MSQVQTVTYVSRMDPMTLGALGRIRTPDPQIRSLVLYPAELPVQRQAQHRFTDAGRSVPKPLCAQRQALAAVNSSKCTRRGFSS